MDENDDVTYDEGSLSSDLAAAWEETAATEEAPDDNTPEPVPPSAAEPGEPGSADPSTAEQPSADDNGVAGTDTPTEAPPADDTPPVSLPPAAREVWKDTPAAMKAAIAKREKDYEAGIVKYAGDAKRAQQMDQVLSQHQHYFAMTNEPVGKTVNDLLSVASNLYMGPPHVKAQIVAGLINQYGVPIEVLDSLLAGEAPAANPQYDIDQRVQQALQPYQQFIQQQQQQQQRQQMEQQSRVASEITTFASTHEFYNDVAGDMADFLDIAAKNNRPMTLDEAYQRACALNPQISQILQARNAAPTPQQKRAASTLRGNGLGGPGAAAEPDSLHAAIEAAWDTAGRM